MSDVRAREDAGAPRLTIRDLRPEEAEALGRLMVRVYSQLEGFPTPQEQPGYYELLANIGRFAERPGARVLVAVSAEGELVGGVVYFGDMAGYGSGDIATSLRNASGIRLLVGFERSPDLDFLQQGLPVFGFRLRLASIS